MRSWSRNPLGGEGTRTELPTNRAPTFPVAFKQASFLDTKISSRRCCGAWSTGTWPSGALPCSSSSGRASRSRSGRSGQRSGRKRGGSKFVTRLDGLGRCGKDTASRVCFFFLLLFDGRLFGSVGRDL